MKFLGSKKFIATTKQKALDILNTTLASVDFFSAGELLFDKRHFLRSLFALLCFFSFVQTTDMALAAESNGSVREKTQTAENTDTPPTEHSAERKKVPTSAGAGVDGVVSEALPKINAGQQKGAAHSSHKPFKAPSALEAVDASVTALQAKQKNRQSVEPVSLPPKKLGTNKIKGAGGVKGSSLPTGRAALEKHKAKAKKGVSVLKKTPNPPTPKPAFTQNNTAHKPANTSGLDKVSYFWKRYRGFKNSGNWEKAEGSLNKILSELLKKGVLRHRAMSASLILESKAEVAKGEYQKAFLLLGYAENLSPDYSSVHLAIAKTFFLQTPLNIFHSFVALYNGIAKKFNTFSGQASILRFVTFVIPLSFLLMFFAFTLILIIKKYNLLYHSIAENFTFIETETFRKITTGMIIFLPFVTLSILWIIIYELVLFFRYMTRREQLVGSLFFIFLCFVPLFLNFGNKAFLLENHGDYRAIAKAFDSGWYGAALDDLGGDSLPSSSYSFSINRFLYALAAKKEGKFDKSLAVWAGLYKAGFEPYRVIVNMGNAYFGKKDYQKALAAYEEAVKYSKKPVEALYNMSQAFSSSFMGDAAHNAYNRALNVDSEMVEMFDVFGKTVGYNTTVVDMNLDPGVFLKLVLALAPPKRVTENIAQKLLCWVPLDVYWLMSLFFLLLSFAWSSFSRAAIPCSCSKCGKAFCAKCAGGSRALCSECLAILSHKGKPHSKVRKILRARSQNEKKNFISHAITYVFPGAGHIYSGDTFFGSFVLLFFIIFVVGLVFQDILHEVEFVDLSISYLTWCISLLPLSLVYIYSIRDIRVKVKF